MANRYIEDRPFRHQLQESSRLAALAVRLAWRAGALFVVGIVVLLAVQAALSPLQLVLTRAVIDRAAVDLGLLADAGPFIARLPLGVWIVLAVVAVAVGQLIQPFSATLQSQVGDRLTGYVTEQLIRAANRWQGLARFEDPALADDPPALPPLCLGEWVGSDRQRSADRAGGVHGQRVGTGAGQSASASPFSVDPRDPAPTRSTVELR